MRDEEKLREDIEKSRKERIKSKPIPAYDECDICKEEKELEDGICDGCWSRMHIRNK